MVQSTQYYPFGMPFADATGAGVQPYKYNGKELDARNGLDWYDSNMRPYDFPFSHTPTPDPLAEKYYSMSPYSWVANNPMKHIDPTGMWYDDYFNQQGKYLGTDNDPNSNKVRVMDDAIWMKNRTGEGTIDHQTGIANSSLHSKSGISANASLEIYKHYNPTNYNLSLNKSSSDSYQMRFQVEGFPELYSTKIFINTDRMNYDGRADDVYDITNLFTHENDHGNYLKEVGFSRYMNATISDSKRQSVEIRAIKAQMAHPSWNQGTQGLRNGIYNYANKLKILIPGLNAPSIWNSPISAPLKIK